MQVAGEAVGGDLHGWLDVRPSDGGGNGDGHVRGASGGYADLSFVRNTSLPASIQVSYENGRLYAWEAKGTMIVFK